MYFFVFLHPPRKHLIKCFKDITLTIPKKVIVCPPKMGWRFPHSDWKKCAMVINPSGIPKDPHSVCGIPTWDGWIWMTMSHFINKKSWRCKGHVQNLHEIGNMIETPFSNHWKSNEFYLLQDCTNHSMIICPWHSPRIGDASPGFRLVLPLRRGSSGRGQRLPAQGGGQWHLRGGEGAPSDPHLWGSHCDEHHVTLAIRCEIHGKYTWNPKTWR